MPTLFDPLRVGALELPNRILMAPLTRARATEDRVPTPLMGEYYAQRASAGLIFSEATSVSPMGVGYARTPGIWSDAQVEAWRRITGRVHAAGGRMLLQLWHVGRISDPSFLDGKAPVAPSAVQAAGHVSLLRPERPFPVPRALETEEVAQVVEDFRHGAQNAEAAGFDGVEIHGANGYLLDQFLQSKTNQRTDQYGGPVENRARLMLDVVDACVGVWGADRVGLHLAPRGDAHDMGDEDLAATFGYVARECGRRGLAFLFAREHADAPRLGPQLKRQFGGVFIANERFTLGQCQQALEGGEADAVAFGVRFIANPDLPERLRTGAVLNELDRATMYGGSAQGYTSYPTLDRIAA